MKDYDILNELVRIIDGRVLRKFWCSCGYIEIMDNSMNDWNYCPICGGAKMEVNE